MDVSRNGQEGKSLIYATTSCNYSKADNYLCRMTSIYSILEVCLLFHHKIYFRSQFIFWFVFIPYANFHKIGLS